MTAKEIQRILDAEVLCGENLEKVAVDAAFGSDLMSDVLALVHESAVLLTGLVNQHSIRTAEMIDIKCVVFVRGKPIPQEIVDEARYADLVVLRTSYTMYVACGKLYEAGLPGISK